MSGHTMKVLLNKDTVCLCLVCHESDGAVCRVACRQGCEEACYSPNEHIGPIDFCNAVEWMELEGDIEKCYTGDDEIPLHDGMAVEVAWNGDCYGWSVASNG